MTLAELGAQLRDERVGQGLIVEDVAARLKIPARILRAIEEGDVNGLPHTVYTRGFIKGYGLILGYSSDRIMELLDSLEDFDEDFSPPKTLESRSMGDAANNGGRHRGTGLLLKLLVITLLGVGGYAYYTHTFRDGDTEPMVPAVPAVPVAPAEQARTVSEGEASTPPSSVAAAMPEAASSPSGASAPMAAENSPASAGAFSGTSGAADEPLPAPLSAPAASAAAGTTGAAASGVSSSSSTAETAPGVTQATGPASEADPVSTRGFATLPAADAADAAASAVVTDGITGQSARQEPALPAGMHQIVLTADAECWVHANADGTDTRQFSLKAGETFAMPFKKSMVLKLGNAGGVKIKYDGQDMPSPGASGQVKTITFPPKQ